MLSIFHNAFTLHLLTKQRNNDVIIKSHRNMQTFIIIVR